jgi:hypothetical protein
LAGVIGLSRKLFGLPVNHFAGNPTILESRVSIRKAASLLLAMFWGRLRRFGGL